MKNRLFYIFVCIFAFTFLFISCKQQKAEWRGTIEETDGVTVVNNPKEPMYGEEVLSFVEELAITDDEDDEDFIFSEIFHITVSNDGKIYALDMKESHVLMFNHDGKYIKTIGRSGQGPGEFNNPRLIYFARNELIVTEIDRMSFFSPEGELLKVSPMKTEVLQRARCDSQGNIIAICLVYDPENPQYVLKKFDSESNLKKEIAAIPIESKPGVINLFSPSIYMAVDDEDNIILGYPEDYEIRIFNPEGDLAKTIIKAYNPVEITDEEKARSSQELPPEYNYEIPKNHPPYVRFFHDESGRLYVQTNEKGDGLNVYYHDVFDKNGMYITRVQLKQYPVLFRNGKLYCLEADEDGYKTIKRYEVLWEI